MAESFTPKEGSILAAYRLPRPLFANVSGVAVPLAELWALLRKGAWREAITAARSIAVETLGSEDAGALYAAHGYAELRVANVREALRITELALSAFPTQWLAHRTIIEALETDEGSTAAYLYLAALDMPAETPAWDEPLTEEMRQLGAASLAWSISDWESVALHLTRLYPDRIPDPLLEDWFRLALYRNRPQDVVNVAEPLIDSRSFEAVDRILQVLIQQGWTRQALAVYRAAYDRLPDNPVLRRRLVALCIREGAIEEARSLARLGALEMAA